MPAKFEKLQRQCSWAEGSKEVNTGDWVRKAMREPSGQGLADHFKKVSSALSERGIQ